MRAVAIGSFAGLLAAASVDGFIGVKADDLRGDVGAFVRAIAEGAVVGQAAHAEGFGLVRLYFYRKGFALPAGHRRSSRADLGFFEVCQFFFGEQARDAEEAQAQWDFQREARTSAFGNVDGYVHVLEVGELVRGDVEGYVGYGAEEDVAAADEEV